MSQVAHTLYRRNDNTVEWTWLSQATDGEYINNGTVSFTLYSGYTLSSTTGNRVTATSTVNVVAAGPITMAYIAGSNGKYQGKLPASVNLNLALLYTIEINATANGHVARRSIEVSVVDRTT